MTKMIIADDELLIRQGLQTIPWSDHGIELAGAAANGMEALEMVKSVMPDILLTDIKMPGMDGLKLISAARQIVPQIKSILLTGYQDFGYAHTAIQLGAIGYVLKPSDPDEIIGAVLKAKKQIDDENREKHEREKIRQQIDRMNDILLEAMSAGKSGAGTSSGMKDGEPVKDPEQTDYPVRNAVIKKVLDYIYSNYMNNISLINVSQHVFMNHIYLSRLIKKETGDNFLDILTRIRLQKACEMLSDPFMKTYEVAEKVGIKDSGYFSQIFKKYFGMTPSEYRQKVIYSKRKGARPDNKEVSGK
jgi:two-component system response regulator YesN